MLSERPIPYQSLLDAAPDGIIVCDRHGALLFANQAAERMFGYEPGELVGRPLDVLIPEALRARHAELVAAFAGAPRSRSMGGSLELFGQRKTGELLAIEVSLSPLAHDGELSIIAGIRDVADRRQLQHDKERATQFLISAIETVQDAFILYDEHDRVMMLNSAAADILRKPHAAPAIGQTFEELLRDAMAAGIYDLGDESPEAWCARRLAYHRAPVGVFDLRLRDGRHLRLSERRIAHRGTVTTIVDMTDDVAQAEALRRARVQAEAASAAKSEFLSAMSHELRTPLNAILGFAQLLERDRKQPLSERQIDRLGQIVRGGEHLLHLIDDVLDLSRIESGRLSVSCEPVDVGELLDEVVRTLQPMAVRTQIQVVAAGVPHHAPHVLADRTRLTQILMNLGSNAIKYGKPRGHVALRTELRDDRLRIAVIDDGIGIPGDKRDKIFEPFQRAGQEAGPIEGTGIGLTISKRLAELMHGELGFASELGRGSEFWVELPIQRTVAAGKLVVREATSAGHKLAASSHRHAVVYVEDNPSNIAFMRDVFEELPSVELLTAPSAEIGLDLIRGRQPEVVIMDVNLPGMNGLDAVRRLHEWPETREIPVIGLSAAALARDKLRAKEAGFYRYLTKPVNVDELLGVVEQLLEADARPAAAASEPT
ncbi:MAG TPA: ATP-binding protein [Kofleriaceae bacterium]|nr:ATP-binding protein [Kofleriaceae bacterium]